MSSRSSRLAVLLAAAGALGAGARHDPRSEAPPIVEPTRFLEVSGALAAETEIRLFVEYQSTAASCRIEINRFEGVASDRIYREAVTVEKKPRGFRAAIPLDRVPPGECGWRAWGVEYVAVVHGREHTIPVPPTPLVWFRDGATSAPPPIRIECGPQRGPRPPFSTAGDGPECEESGGGDRFVSPETASIEVEVAARAAAPPLRGRPTSR